MSTLKFNEEAKFSESKKKCGFSSPHSCGDFLSASQESPILRLSHTGVFVLSRGAVGKEQSL